MDKKKLFLLDGNALIYRAHFAFIGRPLFNSKGLNTSAITGFVRTLWDLLRNQKPSHIAVVMDTSAPTFRHEIFPEYKANREEQPDEIRTAMPFIVKILKGFNIPVLSMDGYEADDIIGTIAKQAEKRGYEVYMVTPDKDFSQLVSENIFIYKPSRQGNGVEVLGIEEVLDQWDLDSVDQVVDALGLQGDSVDNIPGIPGIGPKTSSKLLKKYGSIEGLLKHSDELKGKQKENVESFGEQGLLSKELATINTEVPVEFEERQFIIDPPNREILTEIFKELEFKTLGAAILDVPVKTKVETDLFGKRTVTYEDTGREKYSVASKNIDNVDHRYIELKSVDELKKLVKELKKVTKLCLDTETSGLDLASAKLLALSISFRAHEAYFISLSTDQEIRDVFDLLNPVLNNPKITKIGQNVKFDFLALKWAGFEMKGPFFDTMIAHYLLEPDMRHKLSFLSEKFLDYEMIPIEKLIGKRTGKQLSLDQIQEEKVVDYAAEDADVTFQLAKIFEEKLEEENLISLYKNVEAPLIHVLAEMEYVGVRIDADLLSKYSKVLEDEIVKLESTIYREAGVRFNLASPRQVGEVLFDKMKIPYRWRKTKSGQYSTNEEKLSELAKSHDIVFKIQEHRKLTKLKTTYVDVLPSLVNASTGRIHSSFNQARAATGRLSSENPNLQNIPIRDEAGREIRKAFIPRDGDHVLLSADYSQIELRIIADLAGEESMLEAFENDLDIHRSTASRIFDIPYDEVSDDQRRSAKTVNFSIIYGAGSLNLSRQLDISRTEASQLISNYFKEFNGLKQYMDTTVKHAREHGFVTTMLGRKRYIPDIHSKSSLARGNAERIAINTPIQGTAADMIKIAMVGIYEALVSRELKSKMILQVHDELLFDARKDELDILKEIVRSRMKSAIPELKVPILVEMGSGNNWLEAH